MKEVENASKSQVKSLTLCNGDSGADIFVAEVFKQNDTAINIGQYTVKWKR